MSCGVGRKLGLDLELLWLWHRLAAIALIRPLVWELPYAVGAVLKRRKTEKKRTCLVSMKMRVQSLVSLTGLRIWHCHKLQHRLKMWLGSVGCGIGCRFDQNPVWLWHGQAAAAPIRPLARKLPYAAGATLKKKKNSKIKFLKTFHYLRDIFLTVSR